MIGALEQFFGSRNDVAAAWLFGSVARDTAREGSDVDVAVLFREPPEATLLAPPLVLEGELERALRVPVQIVSMHTAPSDLVHRVLCDGILVAEHDRSARVRFEVRARNEWFDLQPILRRYRAGGRR